MTNTLTWSPQQAAALDKVMAWIASPGEQQVFKFRGSAGTGKTTMAVHLAQSAGSVQFAAFTGKAAHVMRSKGCHGARTIHSLIYKPAGDKESRLADLQQQLEAAREAAQLAWHEMGDREAPYDEEADPEVKRLKGIIESEMRTSGRRNGPIFVRNDDSDLRHCDLLIADEVSMIDERMAQDLMSFNVPILAMGDPGQLPPVRGVGYFTLGEADVLLTEIHRQARDNPIIKLATIVREGGELEVGDYGESRVIDWADVEPEMALEADQVIVGTNKLRRGTNRRMRELSGRGGSVTPVPGDKLVCLRNDGEAGLLNGSLWRCLSASQPAADRISMDIEPLDGVGVRQTVVAHESYFRGEEPPFYEIREAQCFDYGNALTCHKSQGSAWDNVLIFDESRCFRQDRFRWLYTALTRAAKRVTVVKR